MIRAEVNQILLRGKERFPQTELLKILRIVDGFVKVKTYDVSIAFVDDKTIRSANRVYRKKNAVTDVLLIMDELTLVFESVEQEFE